MTSIEIPNSVTSIGGYAFSGCTALTSVTIPNSVTTIGQSAFSGCTGLTSIEIPNSVTSIGRSTFNGCTGIIFVELHCKEIDSWFCNLTNIKVVEIGDEVTSIGSSAFSGCTGLTSVTIGNSVTGIGYEAFRDCSGLISIEIPNSVTNIGSSAFSGCTGLTSVTIGDSVTSIGYEAFRDCSGLISIEIPNSVTNIGSSAFSGCTGLTSIEIPNSVTSIGNSAFSNCTSLTSVNISDLKSWCNITFDSDGANPLFYAHHLLLNGIEITELIVPNSVTSINDHAFSNCTGLTSVTIPNSVTSIGSDAFTGCSGLYSLTLNSNTIVSKTYSSSSNLKSVFGNQVKNITIGEGVTSIGDYAFYYFSKLLSMVIPESVESIGAYSFNGCKFTSINLHDNIKSIGNRAFSCKLFVNRGSKTLLACWNSKKSNGSNVPYNKETNDEIIAPSINVTETTQTTAAVKIDNWCEGYDYLYNGETINNVEQYHAHIKPELTQQLTLDISKDDVHYTTTGQFTTKSLAPTIGSYETTASSISALGSYTKGDAQVVAQRIAFANNGDNEGNQVFTSGLDPNTEYSVRYTIDVDYGGTETATYSGTTKIRTQNLQLVTAQPKVVSVGDVIVSSTTNLDDAEANVGIEWRRTDWTDEFQSNKGQGYIYDGIIEGIIRNLYTEKLWKVRPYYLSDNGNYYYGDWMGVDPTNTSYYEPTVHTDSRISVQDNTAEVRGYAIQGTDQLTKQGFMYWKASQTSRTESERHAPAVPTDALMVEADGLVMTVSLTNLEYDTNYCLTAFVTTANGKTYYGEQQSFKTGVNTEGVEERQDMPKAMKEMRFDLSGHRLGTPKKGLNIIRMSDGTIKKVVEK